MRVTTTGRAASYPYRPHRLEQPGRPHQEQEHQYAVRHSVLGAAGQVAGGDRFRNAEQQSARDRTGRRANRDPRVFPDSEVFDVGRSPNDHLAFGHGQHFCLGAALGRFQMRAMFAAVLDRFSAVQPAGDPVRLRSNFQNGLKRLPVRFTLR